MLMPVTSHIYHYPRTLINRGILDNASLFYSSSSTGSSSIPTRYIWPRCRIIRTSGVDMQSLYNADLKNNTIPYFYADNAFLHPPNYITLNQGFSGHQTIFIPYGMADGIENTKGSPYGKRRLISCKVKRENMTRRDRSSTVINPLRPTYQQREASVFAHTAHVSLALGMPASSVLSDQESALKLPVDLKPSHYLAFVLNNHSVDQFKFSS